MTEHFQEVVAYVMGDDESELSKTKAELAYALHSLERELAIAQAAQLEIANYRVLLDGLFHGMPLTPEMPEHVKGYLTNLSSLVYIDGKEGVIQARKVINAHVSSSVNPGEKS